MTFLINPYTQENHDIVYDICVKTADNGDDASHLNEDPKLIGHCFAGPYINLEPDSAFILNDENGPCGYIIGALDSASFYKKMRGVWLPDIRKNYEGSLISVLHLRSMALVKFQPRNLNLNNQRLSKKYKV